ncbi:MAG: S49 family peptidase [Pirellulales bacterium]
MFSPHAIRAILPTHAKDDTPYPKRARVVGHYIAAIELVGPLDKSDLGEARLAVRRAAKDTAIGSILLVVDSPGGSVAGTNDLHEEIAAAARQKPVVAIVEDLCCSAAYWAICGASEIVATPTSVVGSLGVFTIMADASEAFKKAGLEILIVKSGTMKGAGVWGTKIDAEHVALVQGLVDSLAQHFFTAVARGRQMSMQRVMALADGAVFVGSQALSNGLIDRVANITDVIGELERRAELRAMDFLTGSAAAQKFDELVAQRVAGGYTQPSAEASIRCGYPRLFDAAKNHEKAEYRRTVAARRCGL